MERNTQGENGHVITEAELEMQQLQAKEHQGLLVSQEARKRQVGILPNRLEREHSPASTLISDHQIQNYERINSCYFKPSSFWYLILEALGN